MYYPLRKNRGLSEKQHICDSSERDCRRYATVSFKLVGRSVNFEVVALVRGSVFHLFSVISTVDYR